MKLTVAHHAAEPSRASKPHNAMSFIVHNARHATNAANV